MKQLDLLVIANACVAAIAVTVLIVLTWLTHPGLLRIEIAFGICMLAIVCLITLISLSRSNDYYRESGHKYNQLLEESDAAESRRRQFWSDVSHELRTPLHAILGYSELLMDEQEVSSNPALFSDIRKVRTAGLELLTLLNDMLNLSELQRETEALTYERQRADLHQLTDDTTSILEDLASRNSNRFTVNVSPDRLSVMTNPIKLEKILYSILSTACRFTEEDEIRIDVTFGAKNSQLNLRVSHNYLPSMTFIDGTDETSSIHHLIDHNSELPTLGLEISKILAHELGGKLSISNSPTDGFNATLSVPVVQEAKGTEQDVKKSGAVPTKVMVIAETNESAELLSRYLAQHDCNVTVAKDGASGKNIALLALPDLIVLDLEMFTISGWAVLQHLKFDSRTKTIPVITCSVKDDRKRAVQEGALTCITKPVTATAISSALTLLD